MMAKRKHTARNWWGFLSQGRAAAEVSPPAAALVALLPCSFHAGVKDILLTQGLSGLLEKRC